MCKRDRDLSAVGILPAHIKPSHYKLALSDLTYGESWSYHGVVIIKAVVLSACREIVLNAKGLDILDARLVQCGSSQVGIAPSNIYSHNTNDELGLCFSQQIPIGDIILQIAFTGTINGCLEGFYRAKYDAAALSTPSTVHDGKDSYMLVTHFEPCNARTAFPCFDEPHLKATFDLEIELPIEQEALSNMPLSSTISGSKPGLKRVVFEQTPVMSTYLLAWVIGDFEFVELLTEREHCGRKIPVRVYTAKGSSKYAYDAVRDAAAVLDYFADIFGVDYLLPKCDHVAVPEFISGAMENWGLIVYRPPKILYDAETSDNRVRLKACYVVAHELAHQWFGNLVTMNWWNELWLNEGFATWAGYLAVGHLHPEWRIPTYFLASVMEEAFTLDALPASHPIDLAVKSSWEVEQLFDDITYFKGAAVIKMLSTFLGLDVFLQGITTYLKRHAYGTATEEDLFAALEEHSKFPVSQFMQSWIRKAGFPVVELVLNGEQTVGRQRRYLATGGSEDEAQRTEWHVPLTTDRKTKTNSITMTTAEEILLDPGQPASIARLEQFTFCHMKLPNQDLTHLLDMQAKLSGETKITLVRDFRALTIAGERSAGDLLEFCSSIDDAGDVFVLLEIKKGIDLLQSVFSANEDISLGLSAYIRDFISKRKVTLQWDLTSHGYLAIEHQRLCLQLLLSSQNGEALKSIEQQFASWSSGSEEEPMNFSPSLLGTVLGYGVANLGEPAYRRVKESYLRSTTIDGKEVRLSALGRIKDPHLVREFLDFVLSGEEMALQNVHLAFAALGDNDCSRAILWEYIKTEWTTVYARLSKCPVVLNWCINMGLGQFSDMDAAIDISSFFADKNVAPFQRSLMVALDCIRRNAAFKERSETQLRLWLKQKGFLS